MDSLTLAYLAGTIDADGFITIGRSFPKKGRSDKRCSTYYVAKIGLTETVDVVPLLLKDTFGGWLGSYQPKNPLHRRWYVWQATNQLAGEAARYLLPYLRLKHQQAEVIIRFCERPRYQGIITSADEQAAREELWLEMTALNQPTNRRRHSVPAAILPVPSGI